MSFRFNASLIPQADKLNVEYKSSQCWAFSIGKTCWIENGSKQPLPVEDLLRITEYKWESRCVSKKIKARSHSTYWSYTTLQEGSSVSFYQWQMPQRVWNVQICVFSWTESLMYERGVFIRVNNMSWELFHPQEIAQPNVTGIR